MKMINRFSIWMIIYSVSLMMTFYFLYVTKYNDLSLIEEMIFLLILVPWIVMYVIRLFIGREIDKSNLGSYVARFSRLQPISFVSLTDDERKLLLLNRPNILLLIWTVRVSKILLVIHAIFLISLFIADPGCSLD